MTKRYLVLLALLACLTGCVPVDSLNPLYTDKDTAFDESLLGFWVGPDNGSDGGLEFSAYINEGKKEYVLTMFDKAKGSEEGSKTVYHARPVGLDGRMFLDVVPDQWDAKSRSYALQVKEGKSGARLEPHLLKLGMASYLEFNDAGRRPGETIEANLRPAHWIVKVIREGKKLRLAWADDDDFKKAVHAGTMRLSNTLLGGSKDPDVVITASTKELQNFVLEHADDKVFFSATTEELHLKGQ